MKEININNLYISSALETPGQSGVFARKAFGLNDTVLYMNGELLSEPTRTSIQVAEEKHIEDKIGAFINHNCNPSCKIDGYRVLAAKDISSGEEITFDYSKNEKLLANPFICSCCNKLISGSADI